MTQKEMFGNGQWIGTGDDDTFPVIRDVFDYYEGETAEINILGFASFVLFINGERAHEEWFLPLNSEFEPRNQPVGEVLGHRAYAEKYDITKFLKPGRNVIAVMLGNGWYNEKVTPFMTNHPDGNTHRYGNKKVCWKITFKSGDSQREAVSSLGAVWAPSYVTENLLTTGETHCYKDFDFSVFTDPDFSAVSPVVAEKSPETEFLFTDCPRDRIVETVKPRPVDGNPHIFDIGRNTTGVPVIRGRGKVSVLVSEDLKDGELNSTYMHRQHFEIDFGSETRTVTMQFTWLAFRYIGIWGDGEIECVNIIYADVPVSSSFNCNNETLNWLYKAYVNTQISNMHYGMPSDCPQTERRGYTGDGQLACRAAMYSLDAKSFYDKWIEDIADGQDKISGNVQYTAPYFPSGGGPGGWGCAIVQLPYQYWKFYGDDSKIVKHYDKILLFLDYLENNCEYDLVTTAKADDKNRWCLGDWCPPGPVELPAPFVNTYFYVKSLYQTVEIAEYLGKTDDIPLLTSRIEKCKKSMTAVYFNTWDSRFFGSHQGANAFALDIGLGNETTEQKNTMHYEQLGCLDTGIFGTDIVIRHLFETKQGDLAVKLLCAESPRGVGEWKKRGLTTTPEYWVAGRSLSHPMFGAVTSNLFEHILGIKQTNDSSGFKSTVIAPCDTESITSAVGHITTPYGKIAVEFNTENGKRSFTVEIPDGIEAVFKFRNVETVLNSGTNKITV